MMSEGWKIDTGHCKFCGNKTTLYNYELGCFKCPHCNPSQAQIAQKLGKYRGRR